MTCWSVHEYHGGNKWRHNSELCGGICQNGDISQNFWVDRDCHFLICTFLKHKRILFHHFCSIDDLRLLLNVISRSLTWAAEGFAIFFDFVPFSANSEQVFPSERGRVLPLLFLIQSFHCFQASIVFILCRQKKASRVHWWQVFSTWLEDFRKDLLTVNHPFALKSAHLF